MSLRLAIRVDASTRIGSGHVRRCLALASAARREGASIVFVCRDLGLPVARQLRQSGEDCLELPRPQGDPVAPTGVAHADWAQVDQMRDAAETVAALAGSTFDWVVVDHYSFDARWHRAIREATGARVLVVDDLADRMLLADLVVEADDHHAIRRRLARASYLEPCIDGKPLECVEAGQGTHPQVYGAQRECDDRRADRRP